MTLTAFIRDVDDLIALEKFDDSHAYTVVHEVRERYKLITEQLPPSSDSEYLQSKKRLQEKSEPRANRRLAQLSGSVTKLDMEGVIRRLIEDDDWTIAVLRAVRDVGAQYWVSGGFVRNRVWDYVHGFTRTPLDDVDVIYFDPGASGTEDAAVEAKLRKLIPEVPWSVKNRLRCIDALAIRPTNR